MHHKEIDDFETSFKANLHKHCGFVALASYFRNFKYIQKKENERIDTNVFFVNTDVSFLVSCDV